MHLKIVCALKNNTNVLHCAGYERWHFAGRFYHCRCWPARYCLTFKMHPLIFSMILSYFHIHLISCITGYDIPFTKHIITA